MSDAEHRRMAGNLFNAAWELLDLESRTPAQEQEMLAAALGSRYHWGRVGTPRHLAIGDWQVSRVFAVLGDGANARRFASSSLAQCTEHGLDAFVTGYAHEALARAAALDGNREQRDRHLAAARDLSGQIADAAERDLLLQDLESVP